MQKIQNIKQLGAIVRETRKSQQLTQIELAAVCGCGVKFIRELERGKENSSISKVLHVLHMLGMSINLNEVDDYE